MAVRTYGKLYLSEDKKHWLINNAEPHVCIKLKALFTKISRAQTQPFKFIKNDETCRELLWFIDRYPLTISDNDLVLLKKGKKSHISTINDLEAILLPDYIPQFVKLKDHYEARHYQLSGNDVYLKVKRLLIGDDIGLGKAEWVENDIFTPTGTKKMKDIQIGDYVIGSNGKPIKVSGIYPQGEKEMYRVHFNDGVSVVVCEEHLWAVRSSVSKKRNGDLLTLTVKEMLDENLEKKLKLQDNHNRKYKFKTYYKVNGSGKWYIPITKPVEFKEQNIFIDPYLLGALLGDGGITNHVIFTSSDSQILKMVSDKLPNGIYMRKKEGSKYDYSIIKKERSDKENILTGYLRHYELFGNKSDKKFIPIEYKFNSVENRIALLQGLMDTDGCVMLNKRKKNTKNISSVISYTTTSRQLANDVIFLIQSLGGVALLSDKIPTYTYKGEKKKGKIAYTLIINIPNNICPFKLKRKVKLCMPKLKYKPYRYISNIEYVGKLEAKCIKVEAKDHLYLTENFIVTHNTLIGIISCLEKVTRPCVVTVQTHLPKQWKDAIEQFTDLKVHIVKGTKPYDLPPADIYITKYSCLAGWTNVFETGIFKSAIFDEVQELRHSGTGKYNGARALSNNVEYCLGLSATPIFNYGDEIFNVLNLIKQGCLGYHDDFMREWTEWGKIVKNPQALGTYLRENILMLRRTRKEVGMELPPINTIVHTVEYDSEEVQKAEHIAKQLAIKATSGSFMERGQAARELDVFVRHNTGVAKAHGVANYVKILLENKVPIILAGWHRQVYDIWLDELKEYNPVMYTGTESPAQKEKAKQAFINGETDLFIISLRSGVGLDGLQERCDTVVIGEIDYSPAVHNQLIGRANRDKKDGNQNNVTAIFLVSDCGSDPLIIDMLGIKTSQSHGIINPLDNSVSEKYSDESRLKLLAQKYLDKKEIEVTEN
jgi:hypothetical protein